jgi:AraC-like DNA-binding protein
MSQTASAGAGQLAFSTKGLSPDKAFTQWREYWEAAPIPLTLRKADTRRHDREQFEAEMRVQFVGDLALFTTQAHHNFSKSVQYGQPERARCRENGLVLFTPTAGRGVIVEYNHRQAVMLHPGDWILLHPTDTFVLTGGPDATRYHFLTIPQDGFKNLPAPGGDHFGERYPAEPVLNRLVANYITTLASGDPMGNTPTGSILARNLLELISLALRPSREVRKGCGDIHASGLLLAITQYLDANFAQPDLAPARVAAHFGITPRYVHRLFEQTGTTFSKYLIEQRLRHAHALLADPSQRHRGILEIAVDSGFASHTHFGQRYRRMFGRAPRETRAQISSAGIHRGGRRTRAGHGTKG